MLTAPRNNYTDEQDPWLFTVLGATVLSGRSPTPAVASFKLKLTYTLRITECVDCFSIRITCSLPDWGRTEEQFINLISIEICVLCRCMTHFLGEPVGCSESVSPRLLGRVLHAGPKSARVTTDSFGKRAGMVVSKQSGRIECYQVI